jgi:uncharacterized protein YraI
MLRRSPFLVLLVLVVLLGINVVAQSAVRADGPNAWATAEINLRAGPGTNYEAIGTLATNTPLVLEFRNKDTSWVLVHNTDNTARGWVKTTLLKIATDVSVYRLPVTDALVAKSGTASSGGEGGKGNGLVEPTPGPVPTVVLDKNLKTPIIPQITPAMRSTIQGIVKRGKDRGNNLRVFAKVGDCMSDHWAFLSVIGFKRYDLGKYGNLQAVIDHFSVPPRPNTHNSFDIDSQASHNGFNSAGVLNFAFANTKGNEHLCVGNESPMTCEYRVNKPIVAIIMFGTADVLTMTPREFNYYMRIIINETMTTGIVPLLSTFPENPNVAQQSYQINQVILTIAKEKNLPVMNLQAALSGLPNNGIDNDGIHLTVPPDGNSAIFDEAHLKYGYTVRNLVTLQALDAIRPLLR